VDTVDFNILAANFGQSGKKFSEGDFNYDGVVDTIDFNLLASRFGTTLAPAAGRRGVLPSSAVSTTPLNPPAPLLPSHRADELFGETVIANI
jgi:hypothetical protein